MDILVLKCIILASLFVSCLIASLAPLKCVNLAVGHQADRRRRRVERGLRFLNCFGGGVFLATCLLDLFPDTRAKITIVFDKLNIRTNFPVAEFVAAVGLFLILIVEQIVYDYKERRHRNNTLTVVVNGANDGVNHKETASSESGEHEPRGKHEPPGKHEPREKHEPHGKHDPRGKHEPHGKHNPRGKHEPHGKHDPRGKHEPCDLKGSSGVNSDASSEVTKLLNKDALLPHTNDHDAVHSSALRSLVLLLALSLHSLFEGLALGLQSDVDQLLGIFAAVVIHKTILALSLGIIFVQSNMRMSSVVLSSICFAIMAPIGIVIGVLVIGEFNDIARGIASGIIEGLATGTFLYITFFEVLPMELSQPGDRLLKVLCTIFGFGMITCSLFLDPTIMHPD